MVAILVRLIFLPIHFLSYWVETWTHFSLSPSENVVVITGCDSGFGLATATKLHDLGYIVVACCLTPKGVESLKGKVAISVQCDVTKTADLQELFNVVNKVIVSNKAKLWAIVNNAGIAPCGYLDWMSLESFRKTMDVNYFAVVESTKIFLPLLKRTKNSRIINVCSMAGLGGFPGGGSYCASKHAVEGLVKSLRPELLPWDIHVCNINPAFMRTPLITTASQVALRDFRELAPKDITSQYPERNITNLHEFIDSVAEDPVHVVNAIVHNVTVKRPQAINAVSWQAFAMR